MLSRLFLVFVKMLFAEYLLLPRYSEGGSLMPSTGEQKEYRGGRMLTSLLPEGTCTHAHAADFGPARASYHFRWQCTPAIYLYGGNVCQLSIYPSIQPYTYIRTRACVCVYIYIYTCAYLDISIFTPVCRHRHMGTWTLRAPHDGTILAISGWLGPRRQDQAKSRCPALASARRAVDPCMHRCISIYR